MDGGIAMALLIMLIGMAGVAVFLTVLVLVMLAITLLAPTPKKTVAASSAPAKEAGADLALVAVVQAVVAAYESEQQDMAATEGAR